ncbi:MULTISPECIES: glucose-6-phosphate dehydrogenase [unclassified Rhizobium]|uniref:glucose-6-phosphate dehydrogenase n=1 Tax=unclassified Rhizobium TaxID=2613769 RepID=UPI001A98EDB3|nr:MULTISPECIES: glucose-6-phosphate dehydrogenase [unclassified Rhizobium]MBX5157131.1 glucose-6-phosphate dehydrogenase [Rhizobium sp. NZLR8]MBX5165110.1 glucose-6-phosphate dehydrogenase [Rhizobium sp. NZLR4b]MBX5172687.1 glucose-6-phosphate dehydrogenase [Rhizobium sp. NZLR1b]MBX5185218.1 glucose-6-phosphate dehydrogenase [Rhizobium sp. NZLR5]MBX5189087.1 glucose-6-phosphate dehydrogenase [Rhizobium sp. NZLR3b]
MNAAPTPPVTLVIFGATGDLTRRLLVPAIINLTRERLVGDDLHILGVGIEPGDDAFLRGRLDEFLNHLSGEQPTVKDEAWQSLRRRISYMAGDFTKVEIFTEIGKRLGPDANAAFYLAVPPSFFGSIVEKLAAHGLTDEKDGTFRRVAIEKPFGTDLASAKALNAQILAQIAESQVYRLDHFLGKETVQNLMTARFANMMIESLWNSRYIDHVQITAAEIVDVGSRGKFYDATGALRDMVPNHLFQLLAMIAMEPPNSFDAEAIRNEKSKVLKALRIYTPEEAKTHGVRGAYAAGPLNGAALPAYRDSKDVSPDSRTETYVALKLYADTWRWAGVPFYLRTGKALTARDTEIVITFQPVPFAQFRETDVQSRLPRNRLVIQVQPDEGMSMEISIKSPGLSVDTTPVSLDFRYADKFDIGKTTGYESLLYDLFIGDQTLFQRADGIEAGWAAVQPFLDIWETDESVPEAYAPGSMGPACADQLIQRDGRRWHELGVILNHDKKDGK